MAQSAITGHKFFSSIPGAIFRISAPKTSPAGKAMIPHTIPCINSIACWYCNVPSETGSTKLTRHPSVERRVKRERCLSSFLCYARQCRDGYAVNACHRKAQRTHGRKALTKRFRHPQPASASFIQRSKQRKTQQNGNTHIHRATGAHAFSSHAPSSLLRYAPSSRSTAA